MKVGAIVSILMLLGLAFGFFFATPPDNTRFTQAPRVIIEVCDHSLEQFALMWEVELGRRFDHAVGIICHGGDFVEGEWVVVAGLQPWKHVTPVRDLVCHFQQLYPDRIIVLISCNPGHIKLGIPGVYYAYDSVWVYPDRNIAEAERASELTLTWTRLMDDEDSAGEKKSRAELYPTVVGSVFEFIKDD